MVTSPLAVFACAAGPDIGAGHAMRCLTLAQALETKGWRTRFAVTAAAIATVPTLGLRDPLTVAASGGAKEIGDAVGRCDLLVVDDYGLDSRFESACRAFAARIFVIDDLADRDHDCDLLLDQNLSVSENAYGKRVPEDCRLLVGTRYALLRPEFARLRSAALARRRRTHLPQRLLVSFGATDPGNLTEKAILAAREADLGLVVDVVLGPGAPHLERIVALAGNKGDIHLMVGVTDMASLMAAADISLGAGGTTAWERCCLGLPGLIATMADNQRANAEALAMAGAVDLLGWHANIAVADIAAGLAALCGDVGRIAAMAEVAAGICDGQGVDRVVAVLAGKDERFQQA